MKRLFYIFIFVITISSCEENGHINNQKAVYSHDFKSLESESNFEVIDLDIIENFTQLRSEMGKLTCANKVSGLKFSFQNYEYNLTGFAECPTSNIIGCYFRRNHIFIKNDSIVTNFLKKKKIPIEELETELNQIISKPYNFEYNKTVLKPALIHIYVDEEKSISTTKKVLKEIVDQFGKLNSDQNSDFFKYDILLEGFDRSKIPPPPPPPPLPQETE